jgi:hypothetical protein
MNKNPEWIERVVPRVRQYSYEDRHTHTYTLKKTKLGADGGEISDRIYE